MLCGNKQTSVSREDQRRICREGGGMLSRGGTAAGLEPRGSVAASSGADDLGGIAGGIMRSSGCGATRAPTQPKTRTTSIIKSHCYSLRGNAKKAINACYKRNWVLAQCSLCNECSNVTLNSQLDDQRKAAVNSSGRPAPKCRARKRN